MMEKEPGAPAAHPGPVKWKTKLNDAAPAAERKSREPGMRRREAPGELPTQDAHKRLNLAPFPVDGSATHRDRRAQRAVRDPP